MGIETVLLLALVGMPTLELPWPCGTTYMCTQGHWGMSHNGSSAWDFGLGEGHEVWAAASGTVSHVRMHGTSGCCDPSCGWDANYVVIDHGDGSSALYLHLDTWSSSLSVGQWVDVGTPVGRVGLTGYVCGAHLHFQPQDACGSYYCPYEFGVFYDYGDPDYGDWLTSGNCPTPDSDGDGWNDADDCDDGDPAVHPGATEICDDGVDNDCSGGDASSVLYFRDGDGDGWGADEVWVCGSSAGDLVADDGDCDDGDPAIHPDAEELCNGIDDDCDAVIDGGAPEQMGDPLPDFAARLVDASHPAALAPGEAAEVWVAFVNEGAAPWTPGALWLVPAVSGEQGEPSALYDADSWPAWDVLAGLEDEVAPGETAYLRGVLRAPPDRGAEVRELFQLVTPDGHVLRCPSPGVEFALWIAEPPGDGGAATGDAVDGPAGCGCRTGAGAGPVRWGWLAALAALAIRRRGR